MVTSEQIAREVLDLGPEAFFRLDPERKDVLTDRLGAYEFQGVAIRGPEQVDLQREAAIPIALVVSSTILREWEYALGWNCVLAAVHLESGDVYSGAGFMPPPSKRPTSAKPPAGPRPDDDIGATRSRSAYSLDLMRLAKLPHVQGNYAVTVFYYDWPSNTTMVRVSAEGGGTIGAVSGSGEPATPASSEPGVFPTFMQNEHSPGLPEEGIALKLDARTGKDGAARWPVYGALRLKVGAQHMIKGAPQALEETPQASAVVPVTLFVIEKDRKMPRTIALQVPAFMEREVKPGDLVEAYFGIDMAAMLGESMPKGEHCLYVVADRFFAGPAKFLVE